MNRAELQKINMSHPEEYLKYDKLKIEMAMFNKAFWL